jgi:hypothetical protein
VRTYIFVMSVVLSLDILSKLSRLCMSSYPIKKKQWEDTVDLYASILLLYYSIYTFKGLL